MTSAQIRQSYLDFFRSKQHTIVPSSSLMPDSPNLLFTNAGMNQFVPIFLGQQPCPYKPGRAADTQKCIRAGGKHNDLEDVGLDTYHHTFFEMLGNWSFGDYFKKDAIEWAWELITQVWKFPVNRLYATVYKPDPAKNDPSEFDQEAYDHWARLFTAAGVDPTVHIVNGGKKDNFWMMGETGPCGPCSEIHVDLTPNGDTRGSLVNKGDARCIEIWNLVFIQFNANADGSFVPLPAKHVDTGMGFERVCGIIQCTKNFTNFSRPVSNYESDVFRPLFDRIEKMSGKHYTSTLPSDSTINHQPSTISADIAFRVIADHIRTLSFAIADGIQPGNTDRHYVLRRILRRAVRYGRTLGFHEPFFFKLVDVVAENFGDVFPEVRERKDHVRDVIRTEEESFNRTLDRGIELFREEVARLNGKSLSGAFAFKLYDTYGFPLDLTELMAREQGLSVDSAGFEKLMEEQRARARAAQKKEVIEVAQVDGKIATAFSGFDHTETSAKIMDVLNLKGRPAVITDKSVCYAEMGGQVGDTGEIESGGHLWRISDTQKAGHSWIHLLEGSDAPVAGADVTVRVDRSRRAAIQRHHTVTHILHWALHEVVSKDATQKGSFVGPDKLTFDFNSGALTHAQIGDIEKLVNERLLENAPVSWTEVPYAEVKQRKDVMQFFGDKYGDRVRVVQIGGSPAKLDGYSMELCGGTHTRATGEIGLFRIVAESSIAAGVRRIEAVAGGSAWHKTTSELAVLKRLAGTLDAPMAEVEKKLDALLAHQKELAKQIKGLQQKQAGEVAAQLVTRAKTVNGIPFICENVGDADGDVVMAMLDHIKSRFKGVTVLGSAPLGSVVLVAAVSPDFTVKVQAGKIIQTIAPIVGGKGGGKPDFARGGGKDPAKLDEALAKAASLIG